MTEPLKESAKFVFEGTVKKTKAANLKAISDTKRTAVVKIGTIRRAPSSLTAFAGRDVTIQLARGEQVKAGQEAIFYTNSWIFGENLALVSLGHDAVKEPTTRRARVVSAAEAVPVPQLDPARAAAHQKIRERVKEAPVVISGRVVAVGLPGPPAAALAPAGESSGRIGISEHDPFWREAVVEVQNVHKGSVGKKQVVLRFPSSTDVRWYHAPKFHAGQQGVFSLRPDQVSGHVALGVAAASFGPEAAFTCLHSADFQPSDNEADAAVAIAAAAT